MERAAQIERFSLEIIATAGRMTASYDLREQVQRSGTAIHLFHSESVTRTGRQCLRLAAMRQAAARELKVFLELDLRRRMPADERCLNKLT